MVEAKGNGKNYIAGIAAGDTATLEEIYRKYHQVILHLVKTHGGSADDARDVFQEGILFIYQKSKEPDFQLRHSFLSYFYVVCKNIWSNHYRRKYNEELSLNVAIIETEEAGLMEDILLNEQYRLYRKHFRKLGKDCQKVLEMYFDKVSMAEIARRMGFASEGYAKKRKFKCKEKLIQLIKADPSFKELKHKEE
ncbi:MAG: sigma-70 family RNA polymerase sigma factor [Bacteroidota bacterium]